MPSEELQSGTSNDRFGFCLRFLFGAIAGGVASAIVWLRAFTHATLLRPDAHWLVLVSLILILAGGLGAAYGGDEFWYWLGGRDR